MRRLCWPLFCPHPVDTGLISRALICATASAGLSGRWKTSARSGFRSPTRTQANDFIDKSGLDAVFNQCSNHFRVCQSRDVAELVVFVGGNLAQDTPHD